ncbi:MAG: NADH-quinone oxidoreductase subunit J [Planctomycetota bacterium]|jgi:NADH-quinone oxidoreductase subunit J
MDRETIFQRSFYTVIALFAVLAIGGGMSAAGGEGVAFGLFTFLTLGGSLVCIWERSIVRSAFSLMATFTGVAGFFLLLGADFLAMAQILIYVGGILALILFGVMLSPPDLNERKLPRVLGGLGLFGAAVAWVGMKVSFTTSASGSPWVQTAELAEPRTRALDIGLAFVNPNEYLVAFELAAFFLTVALVAAVYIARRRAGDMEPRTGPEEGNA